MQVRLQEHVHHTFSCNCADSLMCGAVCKHIHLVSMLLNDSHCLLTPPSSTTANSGEVDSRTEELQLLVTTKTSAPSRTDEVKMQVKVKLPQLLTDVEKCTNSEVLHKSLMKGYQPNSFCSTRSLNTPQPIC